jgi:hypothetical protein
MNILLFPFQIIGCETVRESKMKTFIVHYRNIDNGNSQFSLVAFSEKEAREKFEKHMDDIGEGYWITEIEECD